MNNLQKIQLADKTKLELLRNEQENHPGKKNEIYATIGTQEIKIGMSPDDKQQMDKNKAKMYKQQLDDLYGGEDAPVKDLPNTFFGMTDDEIIMNKALFKDLGIVWHSIKHAPAYLNN